ncbi:hypothetical protein [Nonomuraea indica]|uniref:Uncharacterized protein n=1 Tax=Nonomuraea indica TaxID=1581193 RepID=A0ABW8A9I9_9ACTN
MHEPALFNKQEYKRPIKGRFASITDASRRVGAVGDKTLYLDQLVDFGYLARRKARYKQSENKE